MRKPAAYLFAILVGAVIWFFFQHFRLDGVDSVKVVPKTPEILPADEIEVQAEKPRLSLPKALTGILSRVATDDVPVKPANLEIAASRSGETIRIGSFHMHYFGSTMADKSTAMGIVARIVRNFDIIALQGLSPAGPAAVSELADYVNRTGGKYDFVVGNAATLQSQDTQFAYLFDTTTIIADRGDGLYTLGDPHRLLRRDPLIGWFRARRPAAEDAFTFTLVNVHTDDQFRQQELDVLDDVLYEVRDDGRAEDDVIMLGCFAGDDTQFGELGRISRLTVAIRSMPTDIAGSTQTENLLFRNAATDEFTGKAGVFDFLRAYNLPISQAREISDYLPVWAEFSVYEGGHRGRVARRE